MSDFVNTIDSTTDEALYMSIIEGTITELADDAIIKVGSAAFAACTALTSVNLPAVTEISQYGFIGCKTLASAIFGDVTAIGYQAFYNCYALAGDLHLPLVTTLTGYTFYYCKALTSVKMESLESMSGDDNFSNCKSLTSVDFPVLAKLEDSTFADCTSLTDVNLPELTRINGYAFARCSSLKKLVLPKVTTHYNRCYDGSAIETLDFSALTTVSNWGFSYSDLATLIIRRTDGIPTLGGSSVFWGTAIADGEGYIYVPAALLADYQVATNWSTYSAQFRALEDYTVDGTTTGELDSTKI